MVFKTIISFDTVLETVRVLLLLTEKNYFMQQKNVLQDVYTIYY